MVAFAVVLVFLYMLGIGVMGLATPVGTLELAGTPWATPSARIEARSIYGGIGLSMALLIAMAPFMEHGSVVFWAMGILFAGMAVGRLVGLAADRPDGPLPFVWLGLEVVGAFALLAAGAA